MTKILNFHHVNNTGWFENVIFYLKSRYRLININELYESYISKNLLRNSCHISVDDGDKSFYNYVFPILKKHKVPASIYVSPKVIAEKSNYWFQEIEGFNHLDLKNIICDMFDIPNRDIIEFNLVSILKTLQLSLIKEIIDKYKRDTNAPKISHQNMTIENLKDVYKSGLITIGAHTLNHPILMNENDVSSKLEIKESIYELSNILNHEIKYFAYPNGIPYLDFSDREKCFLREAGIRLSFSTNQKNFSINDDNLSIPRFGVSNNESIPFLKSKIYLDSYWHHMSKLKPKGEFQQRKKLKTILIKHLQHMPKFKVNITPALEEERQPIL